MLTQCLAHALDERIEFGVWGGMTERERRAMLRRRPDVVAWEPFLRAVAARRARAARAGAVRAAEAVATLAERTAREARVEVGHRAA